MRPHPLWTHFPPTFFSISFFRRRVTPASPAPLLAVHLITIAAFQQTAHGPRPTTFTYRESLPLK